MLGSGSSACTWWLAHRMHKNVFAFPIISQLSDLAGLWKPPPWKGDKAQCIGPSQYVHVYYDCWWPCETRSQGISSHVIDLIVPDYANTIPLITSNCQWTLSLNHNILYCRVNQVTVEHERELSAFNERVLHARKQAATLQEQFTTLQWVVIQGT